MLLLLAVLLPIVLTVVAVDQTVQWAMLALNMVPPPFGTNERTAIDVFAGACLLIPPLFIFSDKLRKPVLWPYVLVLVGFTTYAYRDVIHQWMQLHMGVS